MTSLSRPTALLVALVTVLAMVVGTLAASPGAGADTASERDDVRRRRAAVASEIDALRASDAQVEAALLALNANVAAETASLRDAERQAAVAEQELLRATERVDAKRAEIAELEVAVRELAVAAYIRPPRSESIVESLESETIGEAELKQSLLEAKSASQLDSLDLLDRAREDLELAQLAADQASQAAQDRRADVEVRLGQVTTARNQQAQVAAQVDARLDRKLGEAASLADLDAELSGQLQREQEALAARVAAQRAAAQASRPSGGGSSGSSGGGGSVGGGSTTVNITGSGSIVSVNGIRVHSSIAGNLADLLRAAAGDGIALGGGGYRDPSGQIALRRAHCGTSNYAVYQMSPSACRPPTARPGQSMHERGLAVDFTYGGSTIRSRSSAAFRWLAANAGRYGFRNLPSEPWHWSVNGQ